MLNLVSTMPLPTPTNDNFAPEEVAVDVEEKVAEVEKAEEPKTTDALELDNAE